MGNYDVKQKNIDLWTQWQNYLKSFYKLDTNTDTNANDIQTENITQKKSYNFDQSSYDPTGAGTVPWTQQLATHNKSPLGNSGTEGTQEKSLPDEYVKEMDRQKAFKTIIENFGALDNAGGTNFLGNDDKIVKKDLDEFLKKNPELKTENPELYEAVNFLIENFEDYTDGWTLFNGKSISKEGMENTPDLPETDMSLWPGYVKDEKTGFPVPATPPLDAAEETWEKQLETNEIYEKNKDVGDGTQAPEGKQAENYLRMLAHKEGLDPNLVLDIVDTGKYKNVGKEGQGVNWHEDAKADVEKLKGAYERAKTDKRPDSAGTVEEKTRSYYNDQEIMHPVDGYAMNSSFGMRLHPIKQVLKEHTGIDIKAPGGTPILAAASGEVVFAGTGSQNGGKGGDYGQHIVIKHDDGTYSTMYAHCSKLNVEPGQRVNKGDKIGEVGTTGASTGNHLHFEVYENGKAVDPMKHIK